VGKGTSITVLVREAAARDLLFLPHAVRQMARFEPMVTPREVRGVVEAGELIEDYPGDPRGHSCLLLGRGDEGRAIHVVCAPKPEYLAIITAYLPRDREWDATFRERRKE